MKSKDDYIVNKISLIDKAISNNRKIIFNYYKPSSNNKDILNI